MEKETFKIDYSGSGVRSLRVISWLLLIVGIGGGAILLISSLNYSSSYSSEDQRMGSQFLSIGIPLIVSGIFFPILFRAIATIAENALYQKTKLKYDIEKDFDIIEL